MGEGDWFQPTVRNRLPTTIVLANFKIQYGKFYDIKLPYNETASPQGTKIRVKNQLEWGHCGRENSPTGTEGTFDVHIEETEEKIAEIYWDCPYIGPNKLEKLYLKEGYEVTFTGFSIPSGALAKGTITIRED